MRDGDAHSADEWHWHLGAIRRIRDRFLAGEIGAAEKARLIAAENHRYYGGQAPPRLAARKETR